ncbi:MAG: DUF370 domain-containing protein [Anaerolineae bacterium]|nr:DUF370 domain-containing protein [Anaerolineae bacterium]
MRKMLLFGQGGGINAARVVLVASSKSTPIKRLLQATSPDRVFDLTYGYPRAAVILFDNGYVALVSRTPAELLRALHELEDNDEQSPPWW